MRVPMGVIVLAVLAIFAGALELMKGAQLLALIAFGPIPAGNGNVLVGALAAVVGIVWIAVGAAALSLKPWAWLVASIVAIFGLFESLLTLLITLSWEYALATAILPGVVLWYLNRERVKAAFGVQDEVI